MKKLEIILYSFNELSQEAQETALNEMRDINVSYDWWEWTYEDAKRVGLSIQGFDLDRRRGAQGEFIQGAEHCANLILKEHGKDCDTYKEAKHYFELRDALVEKYSDGINKNIVTEENVYDFDGECDDLDNEFKEQILECYSIMLQNEYEYQQTDEAVKETIEANDYEFNEDGTRSRH